MPDFRAQSVCMIMIVMIDIDSYNKMLMIVTIFFSNIWKKLCVLIRISFLIYEKLSEQIDFLASILLYFTL